jgi:hypothetical protein
LQHVAILKRQVPPQRFGHPEFFMRRGAARFNGTVEHVKTGDDKAPRVTKKARDMRTASTYCLDRAGFVRLTSAAAGTALLGTGPRPDFGPLVVQLPWVKNVEWAGAYFADRHGYYRDAGFSSDTLVAFLHLNGIDPSHIDVVRVGTSVAPLLERQIDGLLASSPTRRTRFARRAWHRMCSVWASSATRSSTMTISLQPT